MIRRIDEGATLVCCRSNFWHFWWPSQFHDKTYWAKYSVLFRLSQSSFLNQNCLGFHIWTAKRPVRCICYSNNFLVVAWKAFFLRGGKRDYYDINILMEDIFKEKTEEIKRATQLCRLQAVLHLFNRNQNMFFKNLLLFVSSNHLRVKF